MMQQWASLKREAPHSLLLFRMGDFYECFHEDASLLARDVDVTLTQRQQVPMSGIPVHALDNYIQPLLDKGHKIAIAEQVSSPKEGKGLVKRKIVRILSKATYLPEGAQATNQFFIALTQVGSVYGLACTDTTTGELSVIEKESINDIGTILLKKRPHELLVDKRLEKEHGSWLKEINDSLHAQLTFHDISAFEHRSCTAFLLDHFRISSLSSFAIEGMTPCINAAGALISYLKEKLLLDMQHVQTIKKEETNHHLKLDHRVCVQLQVLPKEKELSLFKVLNKTRTAMGARLLYQWVCAPLTDLDEITNRQNMIKELHTHNTQELRDTLSEIYDLERITTKILGYSCSPKDFHALKVSLKRLPNLEKHIQKYQSKFAEKLGGLNVLFSLCEKLNCALSDEPPSKIGKGLGIRKGYSEELDSWVSFKEKGEKWLLEYQEELRSTYQLKSLKIGYSRSFGYYIDLPRSQSAKAPAIFTKRQTLVNNDRFIDPKLQAFEEKSALADERIAQLEKQLFDQLTEQVSQYSSDLFLTASKIAVMDAIYSLAVVSSQPHYCCPRIDESVNLSIKQGSHPLIEEGFIPNDVVFDENARLLLMTGPNMAGKSTYLKMTALLVVMAQLGCFVPAASAHIGIVDKIFTRIGAHDQLMRGQSTFMVEMTETAQILHSVTSRSLVLLDEIGRGTSTYDGMAIAHSVMESLLDVYAPRAIFATHYSELSQYEKKYEGLKNIHILVKEEKGNIFFMYKVVPGASNKSYGIDVAKIAGIPAKVIAHARSLLSSYESPKPREKKQTVKEDNQLLLFSVPDQQSRYEGIAKQLKRLDINTLTPLDALSQIDAWKKELSNEF